LNAASPQRDVRHEERVIFTYHRVLRDSQQSATFTGAHAAHEIRAFFRRVEIGLLTVIAIRGRPVKGHSLAVAR
jgi:hypothetical protein